MSRSINDNGMIMRGVNKVILLATNRVVKGEETTQFHTVVCWDRLAETTTEYVKNTPRHVMPGLPSFW